MIPQPIINTLAFSGQEAQQTLETWCTYCGDFNECQDHVVPVAYNSGNRALDRGKTVNCCNMCNSLAGAYVAETVIMKAIFLEQEYDRKYKRKMTGARWTRSEIEELTGGLRSYVEKQQFARILIHAKMKNLDRVINGYPPNPIRGAYRRKEVNVVTKALKREANL